jgi:hypothetical protein
MAAPAEGFVSVENDPYRALLRDFGAVLQMPSVVN